MKSCGGNCDFGRERSDSFSPRRSAMSGAFVADTLRGSKGDPHTGRLVPIPSFVNYPVHNTNFPYTVGYYMYTLAPCVPGACDPADCADSKL